MLKKVRSRSIMLKKIGSRRFNKTCDASGKFQTKGLKLKFHLCGTLKMQIDSKIRIKCVQEGSQMFKNVKEERIPKGLRVILDYCFGWVVNQEGYGIMVLFTD